ncbi:pilus assembly protein [Devosia neptuniae]|jgi:hypothetical protein|uniref:pilus assembly protein n=1 Tax=Devosia TaxID=46913 RepID=UPI0022AF086D|nr:pilus assembly protein [Devosia neptuniae]MCZ4344551.1 pilus assembly protein [Devosia neptuniae]|tara:strand:+ start:78732 stop:80531 length:1800 start_codon:yes stop_codon:yes gene_type:complete
MMRQSSSLVTRFKRDERGAFAVIFGLMAIVLIALGGAVVDYVSMEQVRNRGQIALDAATLALQPEIFKVPVNVADIKERAEDLVLDRLGGEFGVTASLLDPTVDVANGTLTLEAQMSVPTVFVSLVGVSKLDARIRSQATRRMLDVEVAMVLDNSGSMGGSKMSNLKTAACNAVNILFYDRDGLGCKVPTGVSKNENVRIGVVPFTALVNIGTQFKNEAWLDWTSASQVAAYGEILNFDDDDNENTKFTGPMDRRTLFNETKTDWLGCIEARVSPYDTTDDPPDIAERKFIPLFSPDTVYNNNNNYLSDNGGTCQLKTCTQEKTQNSCYYSRWSGWTCYGSTSYKYTKRVGNMTTNLGAASCLPSNPVEISSSSNTGSTTTTTTVYSLLTERELQSRLCKYNGTNENSSRTNDNCPTAKVLPLTDQPKSVLDSINAMVASGNTNIQQGTVWGMHALTSGEPLIEAKPVAPGQVSKVLIVMTDGENYPDLGPGDSDMNGSSYFSWGFRYDERIAPKNEINTRAKLTSVMDDRTIAACEFARENRDIDVYTIGLGSNNATKAMLTACASGEEYAYFPNSANELNDVFRAIAGRLAALRLSL